MTDRISRRDFLKLAGVGAATGAVLTGCGPAAKYVTRQPYFKMPEYTYNGESTYYATTCRECAAACGLIVRTMQGRAIKVEGNAAHPVNLGKTCARGQATLQGLYNPDRVTSPLRQERNSKLSTNVLTWDDAVATVAGVFKKYKPSEIAFLVGMAPDHLFDLLTDLANGIGAPAPIRYGALSMFESRATLSQAAAELFGQAALPFFDLSNADLVLSFGANFLETWLSPVAYTRGFSKMRKGKDGRRGYLVQFEARMSQTGRWLTSGFRSAPGPKDWSRLALAAWWPGRAQAHSPAISPAWIRRMPREQAGVQLETLEALAAAWSMPGLRLPWWVVRRWRRAMDLQTAKSVLALNALVGDPSSPNVFLSPLAPGQSAYHRPASAQEMADFVRKLESGAVKALFVHGVNPVFELPASLGFSEALKNVETVISFATFPDETALMADYIFPDHHGLESFGYQRVMTGAAESALSGMQPVVTPFHDTRATADVLLAAAASVGGRLSSALNFADEFAFIQE